MQSSITIITTGDYVIITLNHRFPPLPYQFATPCDLVVWGWVVMMQVIRVCDDDGCVGRVSRQISHCVCVCANKCVWMLGACLHMHRCLGAHSMWFHPVYFLRVCVCVSAHALFMDTLLPSKGECGWRCGWFGDSKCMVPQSLRPLNYLSSFPWCKGQCTIIGSPSYCAAYREPVQPTGWQDVTTTPIPLHAY